MFDWKAKSWQELPKWLKTRSQTVTTKLLITPWLPASSHGNSALASWTVPNTLTILVSPLPPASILINTLHFGYTRFPPKTRNFRFLHFLKNTF